MGLSIFKIFSSSKESKNDILDEVYELEKEFNENLLNNKDRAKTIYDKLVDKYKMLLYINEEEYIFAYVNILILAAEHLDIDKNKNLEIAQNLLKPYKDLNIDYFLNKIENLKNN